MIKKTVYIGLALIGLSIIILLINGAQTSSALGGLLNKSIVTNNVTVPANSYLPTTLTTNSSSYLLVLVGLMGKANVYMFNSSGYQKWTTSLKNKTGLASALSLKGAGVFVVYNNVTNATIPASVSGASKNMSLPIYMTNQSSLYPAGTYYVVIDNTKGSASTAQQILGRVLYIPPISNSSIKSGQYSQLSGSIRNGIILGIVFFLLFVAGIIVLIYGILKKPKTDGEDFKERVAANKDQMDRQYVNRLFKGVGKKRHR